MMGYIDCDTYVIEPEQTGDYFDRGEREFRPIMPGEYWTIGDQFVQWPGTLGAYRAGSPSRRPMILSLLDAKSPR
jgi:hypothetical protein